MAELNQRGQKATHPINIFAIISLDAGIFGWIVGIFIVLTGFTTLSNYFHFGRFASWFLLTLPGFSWLTALLTGIIGLRQLKGKGHQKGAGAAKWGIIMSGLGCALFYSFLLLVALGFYLLISKGYIGFIPRSGIVPF